MLKEKGVIVFIKAARSVFKKEIYSCKLDNITTIAYTVVERVVVQFKLIIKVYKCKLNLNNKGLQTIKEFLN